MATTYDKASLVMIPSGYKDDKLYSIKPTDGSGDFTFSRDGSGASPATRVNASGLIEKGRTNELTYSNDFSNWTNANTTETSGQSGYDGTNDAWLLSKAASAGNIQLNVSTSGVNTFSYYAKAGTLNWTRLLILGSTSASTYINLSDGSIGVGGGGFIDATATDVGGGWYRVSITHNTSITQVRIYPADADNDTSGTSGNIYIQDAQLEQGLIATSVIETTTAPVSAGLLGDMPRLDYSGGATCPSLLLEPSRVNIVPQSEYPSLSTLIAVGSGYTWTYNDVTSPEGLQNATKWAAAGTGSVQGVYRNISVTSGNDYSFSVFAKAGDHSFIQLQNGGAGSKSNTYANFDLTNGTKSEGADVDSSIMEDYGNGWYRCGITFSVTATGTSNISVDIVDDLSATRNGTFTGSIGAYFYAWGLQCEEASYPTSYIPTYGSASTRGLDDFSKTGISSLIGQTEGTLFVEFEPQNVPNVSQWLFFLGNNVNYISIFLTSAAKIRANVADTTTQTQIDTSYAITANTRYKAALAYKENDCVFYVNGVEIGTDTSGTIPAVSSLQANYNTAAANSANTKMNQALLFKTRLTNAELASLTTL